MATNISSKLPFIYNNENTELTSTARIANSADILLFIPLESQVLSSFPATDNVKQTVTSQNGKTIVTEKDQADQILKETIIDKNGNKKIIEYKNGEPYRTTNFTKADQIKETVSAINGHEFRVIINDIAKTKTIFIDGNQIKSEKTGETIAESLYKSMKGLGTGLNFNDTIKMINKDNVLEVLEEFTDLSPNESLAQWIMNEGGRGSVNNKIDIEFIYDKLSQRAQEHGIDTSKLDEEFKNASCFRAGGTNNTTDVDSVFNTLIQSIKANEEITGKEEIRAQKIKYNAATKLYEAEIGKSTTALAEQLFQEGFAGELSNILLDLIGSEYTKENMGEKINTCAAQLNLLFSSKTEEEFNTNFKNVFGIEYDKKLIYNLAKRERDLREASKYLEEKASIEELAKGFLEFNKKLLFERNLLSMKTYQTRSYFKY